VLSAHKLGPKGVEYYVSYAGRGAEGYWLGKAAASLGLVGAVDPAAFRALAKGEHPDGGRLLERVATDHTPGWDFTLSAPKSVSLAWALADEPLRAALVEAHREAVKAAFSFLEDEGGRARRGFGGRDGHVSAGLAIACFVHPASRELDPQLHTHGIVCNVVEGSDGRWTALDSRMIYLHRRAAASIYRAELRERVAELGGKWLTPDRRGLSELEGFDREVLRSFSQRRNAIEAELERTGRSGPRASEAACLRTRRDKLDVELVELRDTWAQRARALGVTRESVAALLDGTDRRVAPSTAEVAGSWIGVAAQLQRWTERRKCSAPITRTDWSSANAVPGALVPASRSSQLLPSTKPIDSAPRKRLGEPQTQSSCPAASETTPGLKGSRLRMSREVG